MSRVSSSRWWRPFAVRTRSGKLRPFRKARAERLAIEKLEDRTVPTMWGDIAGAYTLVQDQLNGQLTALADKALGVQIPLIQNTVNRALGFASQLQSQTPFINLPDSGLPIDQACQQLAANFNVGYCSVTPENGSSDLLRLTKSVTINVPQTTLSLGGIGGSGAIGFKNPDGSPGYFDDRVNGTLTGSMPVTVQPITFQVTFGVDMVNVNGTPTLQFYLGDTSYYNTSLQVPGISGQAALSGTMNIKNLLGVGISGTAAWSLNAGLTFQTTDPSHKLRLGDLSNPQDITGGLNGSVQFGTNQTPVVFTTHLPLLPGLTWNGVWSATLSNSQIQFSPLTLSFPSSPVDPLQYIKGMVGSLFSIGGSFKALSAISSALNFKIPLLNVTIAQELGIPTDLLDWGNLPTLGSSIAAIQSFLNPLHIYLGTAQNPITDANVASRLLQVIEGERVDLLSFSISGGNSWSAGARFPVFEYGIPGVLNFNVTADFGGSIGWKYYVGVGIDTTGFYIDPNTQIGVTGSIYAGLSGNLQVLGFNFASVSGRIGLNAAASLSLRNPDPSQGPRIYLDQIFNGGNLFQNFLNDMQVNFTLDLVAHLEAKINLFITTITVFSHDWNLARLVDIHVPLGTTTTKRAHNLNLYPQVLAAQPVNGVLTLDGSANTSDNLVALSQETDGSVDVNWVGQGKGHYNPGQVTQINFIGGSGADRLQVQPGFNVPIHAQAGSGNDYLEDGDGGGTLIGGPGQDTLVGGAGPTNHLTAGRGITQLIAGDGDSTLTGGAGIDSLTGLPGIDTLRGGAGHDLLQGGGGNTVLYAGRGDSTLQGGSGNATLYGGAGRDLLEGGTTASSTDSSNGNDLIIGGTGPSTIWGTGGSDTLIGGAGTSEIHGGRGDDLITAGALTDPTSQYVTGGGNDTVWGGNAHNTIIGGGGDDLVYGCPQDTVTLNPDGSIRTYQGCTAVNVIRGGTGNSLRVYGGPNGDLLIAGSGNDFIQGGPGNNTFVAGQGQDTLNGSDGDDTFELSFAANSGTVRHQISGGGGLNTVAIVTDENNPFIRLTQSTADRLSFTASSYATADMTGQPLCSFTFELPADVEVLALQALAPKGASGNSLPLNNKLVVDPGNRRNVELIGGTGNDTLEGGGGQTTFWGGTGNDLLVGGQGDNEFHGGTGNTTMQGGPGDDVFYGGTGNNEMDGGAGNLIMYGGTSLPNHSRNHDIMRAGRNSAIVVEDGGVDVLGPDGRTVVLVGNDATMYGSLTGRNILHGGTGTNEIHGGGRNDILFAGAGADSLYGGTGVEVLIGGTGYDHLYAVDPALQGTIHAPLNWGDLLVQLANRSLTLALELRTLDAELQLTSLTPELRQALQDQENQLIHEDKDVLQSEIDLLNAVDPSEHDADILQAGSGGAEIHGSPYADFIDGGNNRQVKNVIYASAGDDTIHGGAGGDTFVIQAPDGAASVALTATYDQQTGNYVATLTVNGQAGRFIDVKNISAISLVGGAGDDTITVDFHVSMSASQDLFPGGVIVRAGNGNDRIVLNSLPMPATVIGGAGNDTIVGGSALGTVVSGGSGDSTYEIDGTPGNDLLQVQTEPYQGQMPLTVRLNSQVQERLSQLSVHHLKVQGLAGNDHITVGPLGAPSFSDVTVTAGPGNDLIDASQVNTTGTSMRVSLRGGAGNDTLYAGSGDNYYLTGGAGNSVLSSGSGTDTLQAGSGNDTLYGGQGNDQLLGGTGNDVLYAGTGYNYLHGGSGNNLLYFNGPSGNTYFGGTGTDDRLVIRNTTGQHIGVFALGFYNYTTGTWTRFATGSRFDAVNLETGGSGATLTYGTQDTQGLGLFSGRLYVDGQPINPVTTYVPTTQAPPQGLAFTPDGNLWFTEQTGTRLGRFTPSQGTFAEFNVLPGGVTATNVVSDYSGVLWFNQANGQLGEYNPFTQQYHPFTASSGLQGLALATDGSLWFTESSAGKVGRLDPVSGHLTEFPASGIGSGSSIAFTDGYVWFTQSGSEIAQLDPNSGIITEHMVTSGSITQIIGGRDGLLWFDGVTGGTTAAISWLDPATGVIQVAQTFASTISLSALTAGNDGGVWFASSRRCGIMCVGSYPGLGYVSRSANFYNEPYGNASSVPWAGVIADPLDNVWFLTTNLNRWDPRTQPAVLGVNAPGSVMAGIPFTITVSANIFYRGTVHFTSSDPQAVLPPDYTFTTADNGTHTFTVMLRTAGSQILRLGDTQISTLTGTAAILGQFPIPTSSAEAEGITRGPDSNFWFTEFIGNKVGRMTPAGAVTEYPVPTGNSQPYGITAGPDGNLWFTEARGNKIGRINLNHSPIDITEFGGLTSGSYPQGITAGPDGNLWFTEATDNKIGRINLNHSPIDITEFGGLTLGSRPQEITAGPDGNLWFTESDYGPYGNRIGKITLTGAVTEYPVPTAYSQPYGITAGPDGNLWFTEWNAYKIGKITPAGSITEYPVPDVRFPLEITVGPDSNLWFTSQNTPTLGRITPLGLVTEFPVLSDGAGITSGPGWSIWFPESSSDKIGRLLLGPIVTSTAPASFRVTASASAVAGTPFNVTIAALDANGQVITGYTGTVHFTSTDGQALLPSDYTFIAADNGVHVFTNGVTLKTAGSQMVAVHDTTDLTSTGSATVSVQPGMAQSLRLSGFPATIGAGSAFAYTVTALDAYGNVATGYTGTVHFSSTDPQANLPADAMLANGTGTFTVVLYTAGSQSVTGADIGNSGIRGTATSTTTAAAVNRLQVTGFPSLLTAGTMGSFTVTAQDAFGNRVTGYLGTVHFTSSDVQAVLPGDYTFVAADNGMHTFSATLRTAGAQSLNATDKAASGIAGTQTGIVVNPAAAVTLNVMDFPASVTAGTAGNVVVAARDPFGNIATGYTGTVHFTSSDHQAVLPVDYTFAAADNGVHTFSATLKTAGTQTITATDTATGSITGTQAGIVVNPAATSVLVVVGFPSPETAGTAGMFTVKALDAYGNLTPAYIGTIHFSSGDAQAVLPADSKLSNGIGSFSATLETAGSQSITATDTANPSLTDTQANIRITPAAAAYFVVVTDAASPEVAGTVFDVTVIATDPYGNTDTNYTGTVVFSSADPYGATLPAGYSFQPSDQGVATFSGVTALYTTGTWDVTATDTGSGITGSASVTVTPAAPDHFLVSTSVTTTVAGTPFDVTVTVQDAYNNTVTGYTGTVHFSSGDPYGATLPPDYTFQPSDMGMVTFAGGATLYTAGTWDVTATDTGSGITGSVFVTVTPAAAVQLLITVPATVAPGMAFDVRMTALDPYGNVDVNYLGTVTWTTTDGDPNVVLPGAYTFTGADAGIHTFSGGFTLVTLGDQTITATDDAGLSISAMVTVQPGGAPGTPGSGRQDGRSGLASESLTTTARVSGEDTIPAVHQETRTARRMLTADREALSVMSRETHHRPTVAEAIDWLFAADLIGDVLGD